ncbi:MAG: hypothetical protein WBM76_15410 [Woeseiaceae bacterium]
MSGQYWVGSEYIWRQILAELFRSNMSRPSCDPWSPKARVYLGGVEWAGIWLGASISSMNSWSLDYSMFDKLVLEIKGDVGGETVHLNLEDRDDPLDGTSTKVPLQLTGDWQTFEIDLSEFTAAGTKIRSVPLGFVFYEEPVPFSVRIAKYVKTD